MKSVIDPTLTAHRLAQRELDVQVRSKRPLISIITHEERRVVGAIRDICIRGDHNWSLLEWDIANGLSARTDYPKLPDTYLDQQKVLDWFGREQLGQDKGKVILILKDFHKLLGEGGAQMVEHQVVRQLRNLCQDNVNTRKTIILMSPQLYLPPELEKICAVIDWPLPERYHIGEKVKSLLTYARGIPELLERFRVDYPDAEMEEIVSAYQGLTLAEIELLCTYMMLTADRLDAAAIARRKRDTIRKSGVLDWVEVEHGMDAVGGMAGFKDWLGRRTDAFSEEARDYGLPANPKGVLLVGIQGGGKSLCAKAIASFWGLPLLRLDMGKVYHGIVGSSEANIRSVIKVAESVAPCVLWLDELEKGFSGVGSSNMTDGGTSSRVFASMLQWMQDKQKPVYLAATANDVSQLPPELLRKGRFDEIFFVDLPSKEDRADIFRIHLAGRLRSPEAFDILQLARLSQSFTGAEIEAAIESAMYDAFSDIPYLTENGCRRPLDTSDIAAAIAETVPLAVTMSEKVQWLREWASTRARNASGLPRHREQAEVASTRRNLMAEIDVNEEEEL